MVQNHNQSFHDYLVSLLAQNSLLMGMTSHLSNVKHHHQLKAGLELHLSQKVENDTVIAALDPDNLVDWNIEEHSCFKYCLFHMSSQAYQ